MFGIIEHWASPPTSSIFAHTASTAWFGAIGPRICHICHICHILLALKLQKQWILHENPTEPRSAKARDRFTGRCDRFKFQGIQGSASTMKLCHCFDGWSFHAYDAESCGSILRQEETRGTNELTWNSWNRVSWKTWGEIKMSTKNKKKRKIRKRSLLPSTNECWSLPVR